jgi:acetyl-CoA acetyltransferase
MKRKRTRRQPVIVGVHDYPIREGRVESGKTVLQIQAESAKAALDEAGLTLADVDGLLTAGLWGVGGPGLLMTLTVGEYLGIVPRFIDGTQIGGSSFECHVAHTALAIEAGYCDVALITYGSTQKSERSRNLAGRPPILNLQFESPWGLPTPVGGYAMAAMRHMHEFGTTPRHLAEVAVSTRKWAQLNPNATMREDLSIDQVLTGPLISDPLHLNDCCLVTDGGGAIVMTTAERAKELRKKPIYVRGYGEAQSHWTISQMPDITETSAKISGKLALKMAGVKHKEFDVVEVYDSFTITVIITLESLGFCAKGEGGPFVSGGRIAPGGEFPLNTNGGGLSDRHPGMYGMYPLIEATHQLRGECGKRQIKGAGLALAHGTGGVLSSCATIVLSNS